MDVALHIVCRESTTVLVALSPTGIATHCLPFWVFGVAVQWG